MTMSRSGAFANKNWTWFQSEKVRPSSLAETPVFSLATRLSFLGYLVSLALTQTVYGGPFMSVRWAMLAMLVASSTADIILVKNRGQFRIRPGNGQILTIYLLLTFGTVIYAENWMFSGMRWASHAIMIIVFMISLPQLVTLKQIQQAMAIFKYMMAFLVVISWVVPSLQTHYDTGDLYQGAMGNSNAMGAIAFITAFFFLQNYITEKVPRARYIAGALTVIAMMTVWKSGARSAMIALIAGVVFLCYYYRKSMNGSVLACILAGSITMVSFPEVPKQIFHFAQKADPNGSVSGAMQSRIPVWTATYEGFRARPLVGWGFGADSNISRQWSVQLTSLGAAQRDEVNDVLFMLEGGGILGLISYLLSIWLVLKQCPNRLQRSLLQNFRREQEDEGTDMDLHHAHVAMYLLPVCLLILTQFDNTIFSAGNLISVTFWLCAGSAAVLRHEIGA